MDDNWDDEEDPQLVQNFNLKAICANCPFRASGAIELYEGRLEGIVEDLTMSDYIAFPCHKTTYGSAKEISACMGALTYQYAYTKLPILARLAIANKQLRIPDLDAGIPLLIKEIQ